MSDKLEWKALAALRNESNYNRLWHFRPHHFTEERVKLFEAFRKSYELYGNLDVDSIQAVYGYTLPDEVWIPISANLDPLLEQLDREYRKRTLAEVATLFRISSQSGDIPDRAMNLLESLRADTTEDPFIESAIERLSGDIRKKARGEYRYIETGLSFLDVMMAGEWYKELTIITGEAGGGKTALMGNSALAMAERGYPVLIFSVEMPKDQLVSRWVSAITGINNRYIRMGKIDNETLLPDSMLERIDSALRYIQKLPIYIIDNSFISASDIISIAKAYKSEYGIAAVFVDYLQLLTTPGDNKHYGLSEGLIRIASAAKSNELPFIVLAQKNNEGRIRDCGDADKHAAAWIDIQIEGIDYNGVRNVTLEFRKNRHGDLGGSAVIYRPDTLKFVGADNVPVMKGSLDDEKGT